MDKKTMIKIWITSLVTCLAIYILLVMTLGTWGVL